ncbi:tetratricopeptide repeat protein [Williamwhitmania taraxaci]|uniref:Tetratricopeptide repeat-containing protein n=1 Tax=Williamwhitmania taraxaci TaxID=1640674 RepID=A0A1G6R4K6_9BACT|nr:hypothetical protein [Williamwhitmania taraxaci]SDC99214.1 hypothetical protein SAMN05216323_106918 [Williamwhitmania taraxaci]
MRIILTALMLAFATASFAQNDFISLDKQNYDYYLQGDYKNLKETGEKMIAQGIDYYFLRMRLGILAYNNQKYASAVTHFTKALELNSLDTISRGYIYSSYLLSGRVADANLYLGSLGEDEKNSALKSIKEPELLQIYLGTYITNSTTNNLNYKIVDNTTVIYAGIESYLSSRIKGTLAYTNFRKTGSITQSSALARNNLNTNQNQLYAKLTGYAFSGWEFSGFAHAGFYFEKTTSGQGNGNSQKQINGEYLGGIGIAKNGFKVRTGVNISYSNFGSSTQVRGEGYLTYLPFGNTNFYLTTGGMFQSDKQWGETYQVNQEIGCKVFKFLWLEAGIIKGNSFLYARNQGMVMSNSLLIPATTIYGNLHLMLGKQFMLTLSPYYNQNEIYFWDLTSNTRTDKLTYNAFAAAVKLTYKFK